MKALLLMLFLAACSSQTVTRPHVVHVPVPVPCQAPVITHPVWPTDDLGEKSGMLAQTKAVLAELELRQAYEIQMEAALQACR